MKLFFDVTHGELSFTENGETLTISMLTTTDNNFQTLINRDNQITLIKKLVTTLK